MRMGFHLIHHRSDTGERRDVYQSVGIEVGNANSTDHAFLIQILKGMPCAVVIRKRLMQKHQVNIIGFQFLQRFFYRPFAGIIPVMLHPHLGGQEYFLTGNAGLLDCRTDLFFIKITLSRIKAAVSCFQRIQYASFALILCHLIYAIA